MFASVPCIRIKTINCKRRKEYGALLRYVIRRLLLMIPVLLGVSLVIFTLLYFTPGDPVRMILGDDASEADIAEMREQLGLNGSYIERYVRYISNVLLHLNFGKSYVTGREVSTEIVVRYPTTIKLATAVICVATAIAIPLGILSAIKQNSWVDNLTRILSLLGVSMPVFWIGLMNIILFSVILGWLPSSGFSTPKHWILPAVTIGFSAAGGIMRTTRSSMLEVIRQDYIRTARAKGASERTVIWKHALKNALIPVLTVIGIRYGHNLGGSLVSEQVFGIPGLGKLMIDSIKSRDYPIVQGGVLLIAFAFSFINLLVDILYAFVDPRVKSQYARGKKMGKSK